MCTLTFVPKRDGYDLAMNRDERLNRGAADPPSRFLADGVGAICPRDIEGGTWIAVNASGIALALLNWNDVPCNVRKERSRGVLIPTLIAGCTLREVRTAFDRLNLTGILPFRVAGFFPEEQEIHEWRWDLSTLQSRTFPWVRQHWFSSSQSDTKAGDIRGAVCDSAWNQADAGSALWLRQLHASHRNGPAFGLCVHHEGVQTLSYTEVTCSPGKVQMKYFGSSPCEMGSLESLEIERARGTHSNIHNVSASLI